MEPVKVDTVGHDANAMVRQVQAPLHQLRVVSAGRNKKIDFLRPLPEHLPCDIALGHGQGVQKGIFTGQKRDDRDAQFAAELASHSGEEDIRKANHIGAWVMFEHSKNRQT